MFRACPDGSFELVDADGTRVGWVPGPSTFPGAITITDAMNQRTRPQSEKATDKGKAIIPERADYKGWVKRDLNPALNLRTMEIETSKGVLSEEAFEELHLSEARESGIKYRKADLQATVRLVAVENQFDPVARWLGALGASPDEILTDEEWEAIAAAVFGLEGELEREILQKWLIATVARPLEPGCKVDFALILHGGQGQRKSTFFAVLAGPDWFTDSMGNLDNKKDDLQTLHRGWICEWAEADTVFAGAQKAEALKRFISAQADDFRPPYGRNNRRFLRRSVLVGTTNRNDWCNDHTGARRYPVLSPKKIDLDWVRENRTRIWATAVVKFRQGEQWWFDAKTEAAITERAKAFAPVDEWEAPLIAFFDGKEGEWFTSRELASAALGLDNEKVDRRVLGQIGRAMQRTFANRANSERRIHYPRKASWGLKGLHTCWTVAKGPVSS